MSPEQAAELIQAQNDLLALMRQQVAILEVAFLVLLSILFFVVLVALRRPGT